MIVETDQRAFVCLITAAYQILVVKRAPGTNNGDQIGLPGGHLNEGETEIEAAFREVFEETGIRLDPDKAYFRTKIGKRTIFFMHMPAPDDFEFKLDPNEVSSVHYFTLKELVDLPVKYRHKSATLAASILMSMHLDVHPSPCNVYDMLDT